MAVRTINAKPSSEHVCDWCGEAVGGLHRVEDGTRRRWHMGCPPVIAQDETCYVLAGHYTWRALKAMHMHKGRSAFGRGRRMHGDVRLGEGQEVTTVLKPGAEVKVRGDRVKVH